MQAGIEYASSVSLRDVRVHYNSQKAAEAGKATLNEYPNIHIAAGQEGQLAAVLQDVVRQLKQEQPQNKEEGALQETEATPETTEETTNTSDESTSTNSDTETTEENSNITTENETEATTQEVLPAISRQPASSSPSNIGMEPVASGESEVEEVAPTNEAPVENSVARPEIVQPNPTPLATPESDPDFQAVTDSVATEGDQEQEHQSAEHETQEAERAAVEPTNKRESVAQGNQVEKIEGQDTPEFNTEGFIRALMQRVEAIMPKNEEEADNFEGKVGQVKRAVTGTVSSAQDRSVGPLEQAAQEQPDTSGIPSKQVTPLPRADVGRNPRDVGAEKAVPKPLNEDRVEQPLQSNAQQVDDHFANNEITEEQLQKSNEPTFLSALDSKNTAQTDSEQAATTMRGEEQQTIAQNQSEADALGEQQMSAMYQDRANIMGSVHGQQQNTSSNYTAEEQVVADRINAIYTSTKTKVEGRLSRLEGRVNSMFESGAQSAQRSFERHVKQKMDAYKEERYDGVSGAFTWVGDAFTGLPDEVNAFFVEGRDIYVAAMERVIRRIAGVVARELTTAKQEVQGGRQQVADYVASLPDNLRKVGEKAAEAINSKVDELNSQVDAKQEELIDSLAQKYKENLEQVDSRIEALKAANRGLIDIALDAVDGVIGTILEIKAALTSVLNAALDAISAILLDPIGFLGNVIDGVGQGLSNFMGKIQEYLTGGFVEWLTGAMSGAGIDIPADIFSLEGIFSITAQALNMTWDFIRERAVNVLGERKVQAIEEGFEIFQVIKNEGLAGAWDYMKEQFNDLKATIMDSMMGMLISEVIEGGIKWIIGLLTPAGAFVKAALMLVDVAKFFIDRGSEVLEMMKAFVESISAIASGGVGQVAQKIEQALAISVPVLIGFLASLLGINDLVRRVQNLFESIRERITNTVDGFIERAGAWFKDKKGRRKEKRDKKKAERDEDKSEEGEETAADKAKLEKGLRLGTAVLNREDLTEEQIQVELQQLERREGLKELDAKLVEETEQWHTFMLEAREGSSKKEKRVRRPTDSVDQEVNKTFRLGSEEHTLSVEKEGRDYKVYMASDKKKLAIKLLPFKQTVKRYRDLFNQKKIEGTLTEEQDFFFLLLDAMVGRDNEVGTLQKDVDRFERRVSSRGDDKLNSKNRREFFKEVEAWVTNTIRDIVDLATNEEYRLDDLSPEAIEEMAKAIKKEREQNLKIATLSELFSGINLQGLNIDLLHDHVLDIQGKNELDKLAIKYNEKGKDVYTELSKLSRKLEPEEYARVEAQIQEGSRALKVAVASFGAQQVAEVLVQVSKSIPANKRLDEVRKRLSASVNLVYINYSRDRSIMTEEQAIFSEQVILEGQQFIRHEENNRAVGARTIAAVELKNQNSELLFGGSSELYVSGNKTFAYEDENGKKKRTQSGNEAYSLSDLTHQVFEEGHHHGDRDSDTEVHIFERLLAFLDKNRNKVDVNNKIRLFVRYDACPSCQIMMYRIKQAADSGDRRFAFLRGVTIEVIHAYKNVFN